MAKLVEILAREYTIWPSRCFCVEQSIDGVVWEADLNFSRIARLERADDFEVAVVTRPQLEAARDRISTNVQATKEARDIAQGEELPKRDSKLWKRAALAAFAGYCARPGMDAECAAEEAMFAADAFMNAMEKHLSSN